MKPYYQDNACTIYHGDCREILPTIEAGSVITDPVWPDSKGGIVGADRPYQLFREMVVALHRETPRLAVHLGCDSDPRILAPVWLPFFRTCWLEYVRPHYVGRLMYGSDVAYLFGEPPCSKPGQHVIPGRITDPDGGGKQANHPCPRKIAHVKWLIKWWSEPEDLIIDPFAGSGTTLRAAKDMGRRAVGIEIDEKHVETAAKRMAQEVLAL